MSDQYDVFPGATMGLSQSELDKILAGEPAEGMPEQACMLSSCDPSPAPEKIMHKVEMLEARMTLLEQRFIQIRSNMG